MNKLIEKIRQFREERDWDQYHSPKNLAMALVMEREGSEKTSESRLGEKLGEKLGENEKTVVLLLAKNRKTSIASVAAVTGLSTTGVEKIISRLKDKGVLKRIGPAKGGYWEVLE